MMHHHSGFTLVEVLVTVFLISTGLLGLAAMEANTLSSNQSAYYTNQASLLAYSLSDRMRANKSNSSLLSTSTYATVFPKNAKSQPSCLSSYCAPNELAEEDLYEWFNLLKSALPGCANDSININCAVITVNDAANGFLITISWDDNRDDKIENPDPFFQFNVQL